MKFLKLKYPLPIICLTILLNGCREEIINPENNSGNVNEPYRSNQSNAYTFILNANNISQKVIDYPRITYPNSRIFISVLDYSSGSAEITILSQTREIIFKSILVEDNKGTYKFVQGIRPDMIEINFNNFTGKLNFQLRGII